MGILDKVTDAVKGADDKIGDKLDSVITGEKKNAEKEVKDAVKEVASGYECGLSFEKFNDVKLGDVIEAFTTEEIEQ